MSSKAGGAVSTSSGSLHVPPIDELLLDLRIKPVTDVTPEDIDRYKPLDIPSRDESGYKELYDPVLDVLDRRFTKKQLRQIVLDTGIKPPYPRKLEYAKAILDQRWGMPHPDVVRKDFELRTQTVEKHIKMDAPLLFHVIGKDGSGLRKLLTTFDVRAEFSREPLGLVIKGVRDSIKQAEGYIGGVQKEIIANTLDMPFGRSIPEELVQKLSRRSDVFIQNTDQVGEVSFSARSEETLHRAYRLATRLLHGLVPRRIYAHRSKGLEHLQGLSSVGKSTYSLVPFFSRSMPWTIKTEVSRFRRTNDWLGFDLRDDVTGAGGMTGSNGIISTITGDPTSLKSGVTSHFPSPGESSYRTRQIVATTGHIVFPATHSEGDGKFPWSYTNTRDDSHYMKILYWICRRQALPPAFLPSISPELHDSRLGEQIQYLRAVYRATKMEGVGSKDHGDFARATPFVEYKFPIGQATNGRKFTSEDILCSAGMMMETDLLLPDRFMDLTFTVRDMNILAPEERPHEVAVVGEQVHEQYTAVSSLQSLPVSFAWDGLLYVLDEYEKVTESNELLSHPEHRVTRRTTEDMDIPGEFTSSSQIQLRDDTEEGWALFYSQCDRLTGRGYNGRPKTAGPSDGT